jgi:long-chain acyl-CoA synthetase
MSWADPIQGLILSSADWLRVCRDLAWSELAAMPGSRARIGPRIFTAPAQPLSWGTDSLALDSLARVQMATAAATWCNAFDCGFEDLFLAKDSVPAWAEVMQQARAAGARHFTFSSSGSTGVRKHVRHREKHLADEARVWAELLGKGELSECESTHQTYHQPAAGQAEPAAIQRVVVLCPTHHIYGFIWGVLLPKALGVPVIDADLSCLPKLQTGDLIVAVPDQWAWLAESARHWPPDIQGVSSTAPLPDAVHRALTETPALSLKAQPGAEPARSRLRRLFQIYGSSETAGIAWRTAPDDPYTLATGRSSNAEGGIELTLPDDSVVPLNVQDELQWVTVGRRHGQAAFHLLRRSDLSVQVGGHNVSPAWVAEQLCLHPAVRQASVRLSTSVKPARLKAFVVLKPPASSDQCRALEQWCSDNLPWYAKFSTITYGAELPVNAIGKPCDWPELMPVDLS